MVNSSSNISSYEFDYMDYGAFFYFPEPYNTILNCINWAVIGLVLISVFGNTMIIMVMCRKQNRTTSTSTFFTVLAVSDMSLVLQVPFERWLYRIYGVTLYGVNSYITTMKTILTYSNIQISSWTLVCITAERATSIAMPLHVKDIYTKSRARIIMSVVCVVILLLNTIEFTIIVNVTFNEAFGVILWDEVKNGSVIIAWMDFNISFLIPVTVIIAGSVYIIFNVLNVRVTKQCSISRNRSVLMTLLGANIVFVLTMSPFVLFHLIWPSLEGNSTSPYLFWTLSEFFMLLSDMNAALNFFVYVLSGVKFRSDVLQLLGIEKAN